MQKNQHKSLRIYIHVLPFIISSSSSFIGQMHNITGKEGIAGNDIFVSIPKLSLTMQKIGSRV